jgi:hypothetical protein
MFGLHPNAEIGYLSNWTSAIFETILSWGGDGGSGGAGGGVSAVKESMDYFTKTLPEAFSMLTMMEVAEPLLSQEAGPFVVVALQECQRMNGRRHIYSQTAIIQTKILVILFLRFDQQNSSFVSGVGQVYERPAEHVAADGGPHQGDQHQPVAWKEPFLTV